MDGLLIGPNAAATIKKLAAKHERQRAYADQYLRGFRHHFMFWSPVVRTGLVPQLKQLGFELFINDQYAAAVSRLREKARASTADANNPAFRVLQILEHFRYSGTAPAAPTK